MPGGHEDAYKEVKPVLESISAKDKKGKSCCTYIGPEGSGHFIKMIHNGIEYAEMQLIAEVISILSLSKSYEEIATIFESWNSRDLGSYLLEISIEILRKKEGESYLIDLILDKAGNKGTGSWSTKEALEFGQANTMMSGSVFARYISTLKEKRVALSIGVQHNNSKDDPIDLGVLERAYRFARIVNHQQGFALIKEASREYNWSLNLNDIARIWTNGCIIKSDLMETCSSTFETVSDLIDDESMFEVLKSSEIEIGTILKYSISNRLPLFCLSGAYHYWIAITTERLPANIIQAQRDYFGAHTYQRTDQPSHKFFHTDW